MRFPSIASDSRWGRRRTHPRPTSAHRTSPSRGWSSATAASGTGTAPSAIATRLRPSSSNASSDTTERDWCWPIRASGTVSRRGASTTVPAGAGAPSQSALAWLPLGALAAAVTLTLIAFAGGYGYHRDELYFIQAGRHLAWGYADQGPLTPVLAHLMDELSPGSLTILRLPSAL